MLMTLVNLDIRQPLGLGTLHKLRLGLSPRMANLDARNTWVAPILGGSVQRGFYGEESICGGMRLVRTTQRNQVTQPPHVRAHIRTHAHTINVYC